MRFSAGAFALLFVAVLLSGCAEQPKESIKIGAVLPLSGQSAQYGQWIQEALELGKEEINAGGGINGRQLDIIYEDDECNPQTAASAMQKLATIDKVPIVFGSWCSSSVLAQAPIAEENKVVLIGEAISPKIRDAGDYVFRVQPDARYYIKELVPFVYRELGIRKVSILYINNDFGLDQAEVFKSEFEALGGSILSSEAFAQGATDFKTELIKIKDKNPEGIFAPGYTELAVILRQAKELGMEQQFFSSAPFENKNLIEVAGEAAEGVIYPYHYMPDWDNELFTAYQQAYNAKYGRDSEGFAAVAYDGIRMIGHVLNICAKDTNCLKNELYKLQDFPAVTGTVSFDDHGDIVRSVFIKTVRNGEFVKYEG